MTFIMNPMKLDDKVVCQSNCRVSLLVWQQLIPQKIVFIDVWKRGWEIDDKSESGKLRKKTFPCIEKCGLRKNTYTNTLLLLKMGRKKT